MKWVRCLLIFILGMLVSIGLWADISRGILIQTPLGLEPTGQEYISIMDFPVLVSKQNEGIDAEIFGLLLGILVPTKSVGLYFSPQVNAGIVPPTISGLFANATGYMVGGAIAFPVATMDLGVGVRVENLGVYNATEDAQGNKLMLTDLSYTRLSLIPSLGMKLGNFNMILAVRVGLGLMPGNTTIIAGVTNTYSVSILRDANIMASIQMEPYILDAVIGYSIDGATQTTGGSSTTAGGSTMRIGIEGGIVKEVLKDLNVRGLIGVSYITSSQRQGNTLLSENTALSLPMLSVVPEYKIGIFRIGARVSYILGYTYRKNNVGGNYMIISQWTSALQGWFNFGFKKDNLEASINFGPTMFTQWFILTGVPANNTPVFTLSVKYEFKG